MYINRYVDDYVYTDIIRESDAVEGKVIINWRTGERTDRGKRTLTILCDE